MTAARFRGGCEQLGPVDVAELVAWITAIPFEEWPQQRRLADGKLRPAMITDINWHNFGGVYAPVVDRIVREHFPNCSGTYQHMLSVVMPGHDIPPHVDDQASYWACRVHVPLTSNERSAFIVGGKPHILTPGFAYRVNTEAEHAVTNDGDTPRIHLMFDVGAR